MGYIIEETSGGFELMDDDGFFYGTFDTREKAIIRQKQLEEAIDLDEEI